MIETIKRHLQHMTILDAVLIGFLFIISFLPHGVYAYQLSQMDESAAIVASVKIDGELVYQTELDEDTPYEKFTLYPSEGQYNVIEVDGEQIRNKEDNSPDQIGVRRGWISEPGETAVVLPHKLIIEIEAKNGGSEEETLQDQGIVIPN